jgi:acetoin utilization protein AcuC
MEIKSAAFIHSDKLDQYRYPPACPFKTERAGMTKAILQSMGYYSGNARKEIAPAPASLDELHLFHTPQYIELLRSVTPENFDVTAMKAGLGTEETPVFAGMFDYALLASGGTIAAAKMILDNKADIAFNPSGGYHHALPDKAGGFCYINDIVLGCETLARAGKKVVCIDIDAHHGNGTQAAFYSRSDVLTISLHESGKTLYPWAGFENEIGEGKGMGFNVNLPFPANTDDETYFAAYKEIIPLVISAYNPDVIVLEIGMDILTGDPLTHLKMTNNVVESIILNLLQCNKPILATGGGGYSAQSTARGWALAWCTLCGIDFESDHYIGLGGTFLGNTEIDAGLRDMRTFTSGEQRNAIVSEVSKSIEYLKQIIFPIHGI